MVHTVVVAEHNNMRTEVSRPHVQQNNDVRFDVRCSNNGGGYLRVSGWWGWGWGWGVMCSNSGWPVGLGW